MKSKKKIAPLEAQIRQPNIKFLELCQISQRGGCGETLYHTLTRSIGDIATSVTPLLKNGSPRINVARLDNEIKRMFYERRRK